MSRSRHIYSHEEIQLVRYSYKHNGPPTQVLAQRFGVSPNLLRDNKARGDFGKDLPRKKGGPQGSMRFEADDTPDCIMGVSRAEIERRRDAIKSAWSDGERNWRIHYNPGVGMNKRTKTMMDNQRRQKRDW